LCYQYCSVRMRLEPSHAAITAASANNTITFACSGAFLYPLGQS